MYKKGLAPHCPCSWYGRRHAACNNSLKKETDVPGKPGVVLM